MRYYWHAGNFQNVSAFIAKHFAHLTGKRFKLEGNDAAYNDAN